MYQQFNVYVTIPDRRTFVHVYCISMCRCVQVTTSKCLYVSSYGIFTGKVSSLIDKSIVCRETLLSKWSTNLVKSILAVFDAKQ